MFQYAPLASATAFRLIKVNSQRTTENDEVCLDLIDSNTEIAQVYTALSYQWGSDTKTHAISLNGEHFPLHENLWYFLKQLTLDKDDRMYWVDAICINQDDPLERAEQVSRMADIFSFAHQVTIWLGPLPHIEFSLEILLHNFPVESTLSRELGISKTLTQVNALNEILNLDYWRRAWILPELVLGKNIRLKCLRTYMTLPAFSEKVDYYLRGRPSDDMTEYAAPSFMSEHKTDWTRSSFLWSQHVIKSLSILAAVEDLVSGTQPFHLESWLPIVQKQGCKDPRDRIYSLLGLIRLTSRTSGTTLSIPINYSKPVGLVYWDTIFALLLSGSDKSNHLFIGEVAHLITYTGEQLPEHSLNTVDSELTTLSRPSFFISLSEYVNHPVTSARLLVLAEKVLLHSFLIAAAFNHRHFYEAIGAVSKEHDVIHVQSHDAFAAYLGQHIAIHYEPYASVLFGRQIQKDAYTWLCKGCHQPLDDIYDYHDSDTESHESTLLIPGCDSCSEHRSRIYTAVTDLMERRKLGNAEYQWHNTFQSTHVGPKVALKHQTSNDVGFLEISCQANGSHDEVLYLRASPNFYRQAEEWRAKDNHANDYQVSVPPYIVLAVTWKSFVSGKNLSLPGGNQSPASTAVRVPWLRLLKHVCDHGRFELSNSMKSYVNYRNMRHVKMKSLYEMECKLSDSGGLDPSRQFESPPPPPPPPP